MPRRGWTGKKQLQLLLSEPFPVCYYSASIISKVSALVGCLDPGDFPEREAKQSCVYTPLLLPSRRHPKSSFPLHDAGTATAAVAFSSQFPSFDIPISSLRILHHFFLTITLQWPHSL